MGIEVEPWVSRLGLAEMVSQNQKGMKVVTLDWAGRLRLAGKVMLKLERVLTISYTAFRVHFMYTGGVMSK